MLLGISARITNPKYIFFYSYCAYLEKYLSSCHFLFISSQRKNKKRQHNDYEENKVMATVAVIATMMQEVSSPWLSSSRHEQAQSAVS